MTRHELREAVFKSIFQIPFYEDDIPELDIKYEYDNATGKNVEYVEAKVSEIQAKLPEIDLIIEANSKGWTTSRMGKAVLAILRVAIYEIKFDSDIPDKVAITEAVELAKTYADEKAATFINGVLAGVVA